MNLVKKKKKVTLHGNGFQALEWRHYARLQRDIMTLNLCTEIARFHQEDHLISRIFHSKANNDHSGLQISVTRKSSCLTARGVPPA